MFHQILEPVASNLFLSFLVGFIPILVVLVLLGIVRLPAWQASLAGLVVAFIIAIAIWQMPVGLAANSVLNRFAQPAHSLACSIGSRSLICSHAVSCLQFRWAGTSRCVGCSGLAHLRHP